MGRHLFSAFGVRLGKRESQLQSSHRLRFNVARRNNTSSTEYNTIWGKSLEGPYHVEAMEGLLLLPEAFETKMRSPMGRLAKFSRADGNSAKKQLLLLMGTALCGEAIHVQTNSV